jgi:RHS repeat-associated protein
MSRFMNLRSLLSPMYRVLSIVLLLTLGTQLAHADRKTTYFHTDGLGSVVAASNDAGALLWRKEYAPFGEQLDSTAENEKVAYTGKEHDDITGLTYFGARYYDPHLGRFTSVDPVGFVEANPMSFNRYAYVNNNPYKYVDPDGEFLNFAAKFVLDVGVNVAFNYVTTGKMDVGGALKESAVGILNPAKTVAKAGKLALALSKAKKSSKASEEGFTRVRHYTSRSGSKGIESDEVIRAKDNNRVYVESAKKKPLSQVEAESEYQLKPGRGRDYVETDVPNSRLETVRNPRYGTPELTVKGDVPLNNATITKRK